MRHLAPINLPFAQDEENIYITISLNVTHCLRRIQAFAPFTGNQKKKSKRTRENPKSYFAIGKSWSGWAIAPPATKFKCCDLIIAQTEKKNANRISLTTWMGSSLIQRPTENTKLIVTGWRFRGFSLESTWHLFKNLKQFQFSHFVKFRIVRRDHEFLAPRKPIEK